MRPKTTLALAFCILLLTSLACRQSGGEDPSRQPGNFPIDPVFTKFYDSLGGRRVLGPAISPVFQNSGKMYQYTSAALLMVDPQALPAQDIRLAPLGLDMGIDDLPVPPSEQPDSLYINGHVVYHDFVPLYQQLGGLSFAGKPLTEVRLNPEKHRFEQYFENVGIYRMEAAPEGEAQLLAYGDWKCSASCSFAPAPEAVVELPSRSTAPFIRTTTRLGTDFTGFALTDPYLAQDGSLEQIYENLVMMVNPKYFDRVAFRPVPVQLGIRSGPMETSLSDPDYYFYPIQGAQGYNVPVRFMEYIDQHGGSEISGPPITSLANLGSGVYRQCFANLCLEERPERVENQRIRPVALGYPYRELYYHSGAVPGETPPLKVSLQIWETGSMASPGLGQEIGVRVFGNYQPLPNVIPVLTLTLPGGIQKTYPMLPTNSQGEAQLRLDPALARDGSLVPYQVCVTLQNQPPVCVRDSYVVWRAGELQTGGTVYLPLMHKLYFQDAFNSRYLPLILR